MQEKEVWKPIKGYEGRYEISNFGNVKSISYLCGKNVKELKPFKDKDGYLTVNLFSNGLRKTLKVHRLVAFHYIENNRPQIALEINHKDECKTNNHYSNLEWVTTKENNNYGTRKERARISNTNGKLSKKIIQYDLNGFIVKEWNSIMEIQRECGYNHSMISFCCNGKRKRGYGYIWKFKE